MARYTTTGTVNSVSQINAELEKIETSLEETLSRKGDAPNQMNAVLDMNDNEILNTRTDPNNPKSLVNRGDVYLKAEVDSKDAAVLSAAKSYTDTKSFESSSSGGSASSVFNIESYGAVSDNSTDNKSAIDAAIADLSAAGGGCLYIPPSGVFRTSGNHDVPSNMTVKGDGYNSCLKKTSGSVNRMFVYISENRPAIDRRNLEFRDLRIEGLFDETGAEGEGAPITLVGFGDVLITNCFFYDIEAFCLNMNQCENVKVIGNDFQRICRDIVGIWGTPNIIVANNSFIGGDDDCISLNQARFESTNDVMRDGLIVTGNYLRDTGSMKIQQAKNAIISNNVIKLCKGGRAIFLEGLASAQGEVDARNGNVINVIVESNQIIDQIDRGLAYDPSNGSINQRIGIRIDSKEPTILEYDAEYQYNYSDTGELDTGEITECSGLVVRNNIIKRTASPDGVKTYSELFGFGPMFTRFKGAPQDLTPGYINSDGTVDPVISESMLQMRPVEIRDGLINSQFSGNYMQGSGGECVLFSLDTWTLTDLMLRNVVFENNTFRDFSGRGINLISYSGTEQSVRFIDNIFDADPYLRDFSRNPDGSWSSLSGVSGIDISLVEGCTIERNVFMNCAVAFRLGSNNSSTNLIRMNTYVGEPSETANPRVYQPDNKGMGVFSINEDREGILDYVNSDPTSPDYLKRKPKQLKCSLSRPTEGYYFSGQIVESQSITEVGDSILIGFKKLNDGSSNTANDWKPLYASTVATVPVWSYTGNSVDMSVQSSAMRDVTKVGPDTFYALSNSPGDFRVFRYNITTYTYDNVSFPINGFGEIVNSMGFADSTSNRWIQGKDTFTGPPLLKEYDSSFNATGVVRNLGGSDNTSIGSTGYIVGGSNLTIYNADFSTLTNTVDLGVNSIRSVSKDSAGTGLIFVNTAGDVYSCDANGANVTLLFQSGLSAAGIFSANDKIYVGTASEVREYELS